MIFAPVLFFMASASTTDVTHSGRPVVPVPSVMQPCPAEPCGLHTAGRGRPIDREAMGEKARAFFRTELLPTISDKIAASDYVQENTAKRLCRVTFTVVISPDETVSEITNLQERDEMFFEELAKIVREAMASRKGDVPDGLFNKPFSITVGDSPMPCRHIRLFTH